MPENKITKYQVVHNYTLVAGVANKHQHTYANVKRRFINGGSSRELEFLAPWTRNRQIAPFNNLH